MTTTDEQLSPARLDDELMPAEVEEPDQSGSSSFKRNIIWLQGVAFILGLALLIYVIRRVGLRERPKLGVGTEDEVDRRAGPFQLARGAIAPLVHMRRGAVAGRVGRLPFGPHVEQVDEEVVRQRLGPLGEDAVPRLLVVGVQGAHPADEDRHLRSGQVQQVGPFDQLVLR